MQSERRHCGGDSNLRLCSDFAYVPSPCLRRQTALLTKGGRRGRECGMGWYGRGGERQTEVG